MPHGALPNAFGHDTATTLTWYRTVASWNVLIVAHAQIVAQLMGHGRCYTNGALGVVLRGYVHRYYLATTNPHVFGHPRCP